MTPARLLGLAVCLACIAIGVWVVRRGNRSGYVTIVGGAVLGALWIAIMVAA